MYGVNAAQVTRPGSVIVDRKVASVHVAFPSTVVDPKMIEESVIAYLKRILCGRCNKPDCSGVCRG